MVSATQLSSYLYCPRKLFISRVLLIEEQPREELVKGKIWHETHEAINKSEEKIVLSIRTNNYQDILSNYRQIYSKLLRNIIIRHKSELKSFNISLIDIFKDYWSSFEIVAEDHALNVTAFIERYNLYGTELWTKLTPKILSEQYFKSEKLNLSGIIDVLEIHDVDVLNGIKTYVPVELKTGKYPQSGIWDGHRIQLAAYMLLLEDAGKVTSEAVIHYRGSEKRAIQMNSFLRLEVIDLIYKTDTILKSFEIPEMVENKTKCKSCQFKDVCYNPNEMKTLLENAKSKLKTSS